MRRLLVLIVLVLTGALIFFSYRKKDTPPPEPVKAGVDPKTTPRGSDAPFVTPEENPHWNALINEYESYLSHALGNRQAPGVAVTIVLDSSIIYLKGLGLRDVPKGDSVSIHSIFRLGSVSKPIASFLTGILVDRGILHWDDKVTRYLPAFKLNTKENTDSLSIRHLLSHTTGLPYHAYTDRVDDGANMDTLIFHLRDVGLVGKPGKVYSYQNVAYSITARVIEAITGKSYADKMKEEVFTPLGMNDASMDFTSLIESKDHARPHVYTRKKGWVPVAISSTYYNAGPAGGVNASISDMAQWLRSMTAANSNALKATTKKEIFKPAIRAIARNRNFRKWKRSRGSYYAMGWRVLTFKDDTLHYHGGYVNGYRSEVAIKEDERLGICLLVNSAGPLADRAIPEFFRLYERYAPAIRQWDKMKEEKLVAQRK